MWKLAAILHSLIATVIMGILVIVIVTVPSLFDQAMKLIPWAVASGIIAAVPLSIWAAKAVLAQSKPTT